MTRTFILAFSSLVALTALAAHAQDASRRGQTASELALSASFAPPRYVIGDSARRERVREFLRARVRDSSETFQLRGNVLTLSPRLAERLAAEEPGEAREPGRRRARARLERLAGPGVEEDGIALPAAYLPDDIGLQTMPQWPLHNTGSLPGSAAGVDIGMTRVWEQFDGSDSLIVAVLDAGFNFGHPDLQDRWFVNAAEANGVAGVDDDGNGLVDDVRGWDFVDSDNDPRDYHGHGTQTGGLIAATFDNGIGIAGMLPRVRILPVRVLSTAGFGNTSDIASGIRYAAKMKVHVISFSIGVSGAPPTTPCLSQTLCSAFSVARDSGVIIAAASANDGVNMDAAPRQPSSYGFDNIYVVAAHNADGALSGFSNYGATTVDLAAPGTNITTTTIPPALTLYQENYESFDSTRWALSGGTWAAAPDSMQGAKSFRWVSGATATATHSDTLSLRGRRGGLLRFRLNYQPANANDRLFVDVLRKGASANNGWVAVGAVGSAVSNQMISFNLGPVDDTLFRVRFQACVLNSLQTNCSASGSTAGRVIRVDELQVLHADLAPENQAKYEQATGGTSVAAPFFAGYAGLMRLATARTGLPLTRQRMLAGTVPVPALAGKVITGGRLDVAKGLDFYLKTLPRITVSDSADTAWGSGAAVAYTLGVADSSGPRTDFTFAAIGAPAGSALSAAGLFTWSPGSALNGEYALRAKAEKGSLVLRKHLRFTVGTVTALPPAAARAPVLRVGNRAFLLPAAALSGGTRLLRVDLYGPDGRLVQTVTGELDLPPGAAHAEYRLRELARAVGARAWLDGKLLLPAPGN